MNLTDEQALALIHWRSRYGRVWKTRLLEAWGNGNYRYSHHADTLQSLRNILGPSGLRKLNLDQYAKAPKRTAPPPTA